MLGKDTYENIIFKNNYPFTVVTSGLSKTFPSHWHHYAELVIVFQDKIEYSINKVPYTIKKKDLLLVHPGELHSLLYNKEKESSYMLIQFDASFILSLPDFKKHLYWMKNFHLLPYEENQELSDKILSIALEINELFKENTLYKDARICSRLLEIYALFAEYVISDKFILNTFNHNFLDASKQMKMSTHQSQITQKMIDVCSYLSQNCTKDISLSTAANYAGFSKYHFSRLFSQFTGMSFVDFLMKERLNKASELLLDEKLTITDVAMRSGFSSISTFNRSFQKYNNDTPTNYRKKYTTMKSTE